MKTPEFAKIGNEKYKINTSYLVAIECDKIARDDSIGDYERALAIIYKLFGDKGLEDSENHEKLLEIAQKYLSCGKELDNNDEKPDMDFEQDMDYIIASFRSDYNIDLNNEDMDWWQFSNLINGLSNSELGNCCVLNRVRNLRNYDLSEIKDQKTRRKIMEAKKKVALKNHKSKKFTDKQKASMDRFKELMKGE